VRRLITLIKNNPFLRGFQPCYAFLRDLFRKSLSRMTDMNSMRWALRDPHSAKVYWGSRHDETRSKFLISLLEPYAPESILEIGCNSGNKLFPLALRWPHARLEGVDINKAAVSLGNKWLRDDGIRNVELRYGRAENLQNFPVSSFDVVFSWATLIYPRPTEIKRIIAIMLRICRKAVVMIERQNCVPQTGPAKYGVFFDNTWSRDYQGIALEIDSRLLTYIAPVPLQIWRPGGGGGAIIRLEKHGPDGTTQFSSRTPRIDF
jgi:SAM-dependent methyltransferase